MLRRLAYVLSCLMLLPLCLPLAPAARADTAPPHPVSALALALQLQRMEQVQAKAPSATAAHPVADKTPHSRLLVPLSDADAAKLANTSAPKPVRPKSPTLLDEVGMLSRPVAAPTVAAWKQELKTTHPASARAAELHVWLGEWELGANQQPERAQWHFAQAQHLTPATDRLHGLAAYDAATALFYAGAYDDATDAFHRLLVPGTMLPGYSRQTCAHWYRHAAACAGSHEDHRKLGIPEPPRLDPNCGAASLAACLVGLGLPSDYKTVRAVCRVTGEGSSLHDILQAAYALGLTGRALTADDAGLMALPKPLVAYVEQDHFVALVRADKKGVSYLCSDCGPWPGGRVDLTWKQWHSLSPGLYASVVKPGSAWDKKLAVALSPLPGAEPSLRLASIGPLGWLLGSNHTSALLPSLSLLRGHVQNYNGPTAPITCGYKPTSQQCPSYISCPMSCPVSFGNGGASEGDPVNLATGEEEYQPAPDLTVYNPVGPNVVFQRVYNSLRDNYNSNSQYLATGSNFGSGWDYSYDIYVALSSSDQTAGMVVLPNGSSIRLSHLRFGPPGLLLSTPKPVGQPYSRGCDVDYGVNMTVSAKCQDYTANVSSGSTTPGGPAYTPCTFTRALSFAVTLSDRTQWLFEAVGHYSPVTGSAYGTTAYVAAYGIADYGLTAIVDRNGHSLRFSQTSNGYTINNDAGTALLSVSYSNSAINTITDCYGRCVYYHVGIYNTTNVPQGYPQSYPELDHVSQIVASTTTSGPDRYAYDYAGVKNNDGGTGGGGETIPFLHSLTVPMPSGPAPAAQSLTPGMSGTSTAFINYSDNTCYVSSLVDGNGNTRTYTVVDGTHTKVTVTNPQSQVIYSNISGFGTTMSKQSETDGAGNLVTQNTFFDRNDPYRPSSVTDGNGNTTSYTWDHYGNMTTMTPPSNGTRTPAKTINTYIYTNFALGELTDVREGSKAPTHYDYYEPSGLVKTMTAPQPGTAGGTATVSYDYTYDNLGNPLTTSTPGATAQAASWGMQHSQIGHQIGRAEVDGWGANTNQDPPAFLQYGPYTTQVQAGNNTASWEMMVANNTVDNASVVQLQVFDPTTNTIIASRSVTRREWTRPYQYQVFSVPFFLSTASAGHALEFRVYWASNSPNYSYVRERSVSVTPTILTTFSYTGDGSYSQPAAIGQPLTITDNLGKVTHLRYDSRGNCTAVADALGNTSGVTYNIADQPLTATAPATGQQGSGNSYSLNAYLYPGGPLTGTTAYDESGTSIRQVSYAYGPEGETLGVGGSTEPAAYTYDALYRLSALADGNGSATHYFYSTAGYLYQVAYPGANAGTATLPAGTRDTVTLSAYDLNGNVKTRVDGNNVTTTYAYNDPESLLTDTSYSYPSGYAGGTTGNVAFSYDDYGRRAGMTDGTGSQVYVYDDEDNLLTHITTYTGLLAASIGYGYYPNGSRQSMSTPAGSFAYTYDDVGRMTGLTNPFGEASGWQYLDNGWLNTQTLGNGAVTTYTYNPLGQMTDLANRKADGTLLSDFGAMTYDGVGNRVAETTNIVPTGPSSGAGPGYQGAFNGSTTYQYDAKNQIAQEQSSRNGGYTNTFGYDTAGNPTTFKGVGNTYNTNNQNSNVTYDGNGNPAKAHGLALTFDPENRLTVTSGSGRYGYTGDGLRAWITPAYYSSYTYFVYDGDQPVCELGANGGVSSVNTFGANGLVSSSLVSSGTGGTQTQFYTFDPRGNTVEVLGSAGGVGQSVGIYGAFGPQANSYPGRDVYFGYGAQWGYRADNYQAGLLLLDHRYYDPSTGRFLTRDPISYNGGVNLYAYTGNNPVNDSDPSGHGAIPWPVAGAGPLGLAAGVLGALILLYCLRHPEACTVFPGLLPPYSGAPPLLVPKPPLPPFMNDPNPETNPLTNADPADVVPGKLLPPGWKTSPGKGPGTTRYSPPGHDGVQVLKEPGDPTATDPTHRGPYCRISNGTGGPFRIPLKGNPAVPKGR